MRNNIDISKVQWDEPAINPNDVKWDAPQVKKTSVAPPQTTLDKVMEYVSTPPEQPKTLSEFVTKALPRSAANTVFGAGKILADTLTGDYQSVLGNPRSIGEGLGTLATMGKNMVAPFGLAGSDAFKEAWTTAPVQSALSIAPVARGAGRAIANPGATMRSLADIVNTSPNKVQQLSERWNIPTTLNEQQKGMSSRTDVLMERAPWKFGNKAFRQKQYDAAHGAAKDAISKYMINPNADDVLLANEAYIDNLYNNVKELASRPENNSIQPTQTRATAVELMDRYPDVFKKLQDGKLEKHVLNIVGDTAPETVNYLDAAYQPVSRSTPATMSFDDMWQLRKNLGTKIGQAKRQLANGAMDESEVSQLNALYHAVSNDIDSTPLAGPLKQANEAYKHYNVKYNALARAYEKVTKEVGDKKLFSPARFANELDKMVRDVEPGGIYSKASRVKGDMFTPAEKSELSGLANILQVVKRSGQYLENPPTGNRWGSLTTALGSGGVAFGVGGLPATIKLATTAAVTALITKFLTTTKAGKVLAVKASRVSPTSPVMRKIIAQAAMGASMRMPGQTVGENQDSGGLGF